MDQERLRARILELFIGAGGDEQLPTGKKFRDDPTWDSIRYAEFLIALQNTFRIRLSTREIVDLDSLETAEKIVATHLKSID
ncbi:MAG: acyl carrier protein [Bdellovibrionales bacterium]